MKLQFRMLLSYCLLMVLIVPTQAQSHLDRKCKAVRDYTHWGVHGYLNGSLVFDWDDKDPNNGSPISSAVDEVRVFGPFEWATDNNTWSGPSGDDYGPSSVDIPADVTFTITKINSKKYQGIAYYDTDYGVLQRGGVNLYPVYFSKGDPPLDISGGTVPFKSIKLGRNCKCKIEIGQGGKEFESDANDLKDIETYTAEVRDILYGGGLN